MNTANRTILRELPCFCFEVCAASEKQLCKLNRKLIACQFLPVLKKITEYARKQTKSLNAEKNLV